MRWQRLQLAMEMIAMTALVLVVILTVVDVTGRYFFNAPLDGATELTEFGIALVVFSALPAVTWRREHISVDLLERFFPAGYQRWRRIVVSLLFAVCFAGIGMRVWQLAERASRREIVSEYLSIPLSWIQYYIAVVCFITALGALLQIWRGADVAAEQ